MKRLLLFCLAATAWQAVHCQWNTNGNNISNSNTGNVGIGTTTPRTNLEVNGYVSATTGLSVGGTSFSSNAPVNGFTLSFQNSYGTFLAGSGSGFGIKFQTNSTDRLAITDANVSMLNTNVLVGSTTDNGNKLQVNGTLWTTGLVLPTGAAAGKVLTSDANGNATWQTASGGGWGFGGNTVGAVKTFGTIDNYDLPIITNNTERMRITATGAVCIGTTNPYSYMLAVNGSAIFTAAWVKPYANWPDYVFAKNYRLPSLDSVSSYIQAHHHLADMPSAETVAKTGLDLGGNQAALLKKIEELTLYLIDQQKEITVLKEQNAQIKEQNTQLKTQQERIDRLEQLVEQLSKKGSSTAINSRP